MKDYEQIIQEAAQLYQVDPELIRRIIQAESAGRPNALSKVGAQGLMQLMPGTARDMGVRNILDPRENIVGGTKYISQLLKKYGNTEKALAAYNAGPANVDKYGGIPPFDETRNYVSKILAGYNNPMATSSLPTKKEFYHYGVKDEHGNTHIMLVPEGEPEPTDSEIEEFLAEYAQENPQRSETLDEEVAKEDKFKSGILEQSEPAQLIQSFADDPKSAFNSLKEGIVESVRASGGDPVKLASNMVVDEAKAAYKRVNENLDAITDQERRDPLTRWSRVLAATASGIPVFGELVKPMRESIPQNPQIPIDAPRVAGNLTGAAVDATLARFTPGAAMTGIRGTARGMTRAGSALAQNATNRSVRNAELGPVTPREIARDIFSKRGAAVLASTAVSPTLGMLVGAGAGASEIAKLAGRSNRLANIQARIGRAMMPDNPPNLWEGGVPEGINPALIPDEGLAQTTIDDIIDPQAIDPQELNVIRPDPAPDLETLWDANPELNSRGGFQDLTSAIDPRVLEPDIPPSVEDLWESVEIPDKPVGMQSFDEPVREVLPEIKGKEGKRIPFEDQNRVSRPSRFEPEEEVSLDPEDNIDIDLDEPEIVSRRGQLIDTTKPPEKNVIEIDPNAPNIPFADLEVGSVIRTKNGRMGSIENIDQKSATIRWDNGGKSTIARKDVSKVETSPKGQTPEEVKSSKIPLEEGEIKLPHSSGQGFVKLLPDKKTNFLEVTDIWVDPKSRRQGIATELYKDAVKQAKAEGKEGIISYSSHRNAHSDKRWNKLLSEGLAEKLDNKGTYILRNTETSLEQAVREASGSIDEPISDIDPFETEPTRGHTRTNRPKVEPQYPPAQERLPKYSLSGKPTPRSELTNPRMRGDSPRQLGLNDRAIRQSKAGWELSDETIKSSLSKGTGHIQVNIDELLELAKEDVKRPGRFRQKVGKTDKLTRAINFLASKSKTEPVKTPEISVKKGKLILDDGLHRTIAAQRLGEKSVPVRIDLQDLEKLDQLGLRYRKLWNE